MACVAETKTIPLNQVSRILEFKVANEEQAVAAQENLKKLHELLKTVDGVENTDRYICKEFWDVKYCIHFKNVSSLVKYMESDVQKKEAAQIIQNIEKLNAVGGKVHQQNFTYESW